MGIPRKIPPILTRTEWNELIDLLTAYQITFSTSTFYANNAYLSGSETLECANPGLTNLEMLDAIYGYIGGVWSPGGLPTGSSVLIFKDSTSLNIANLFGIRSTENSDNILLSTDVGFLAQKDIQAGGFLGATQGAVLLGHGLFSATDHPKLLLTHAPTGSWQLPTNCTGGYDTLFVDKIDDVPSGSTATTSPGNLALKELHQYSGSTCLTKLHTDTYGVLELQNGSGSLGTLDTSFVFTDFLNSASGRGITLYDGINLAFTATETITSGSIVALNGDERICVASRDGTYLSVIGVAKNDASSGSPVIATVYGPAYVKASETITAGQCITTGIAGYAAILTGHSHSSGSYKLTSDSGYRQTSAPDTGGSGSVASSTHSHTVQSEAPLTSGPNMPGGTGSVASSIHSHTVASHSHTISSSSTSVASSGHGHTVTSHLHSIAALGSVLSYVGGTTDYADGSVGSHNHAFSGGAAVDLNHSHGSTGNTSPGTGGPSGTTSVISSVNGSTGNTAPATSGPDVPGTTDVATYSHSHTVASHSHGGSVSGPIMPGGTTDVATYDHTHTVQQVPIEGLSGVVQNGDFLGKALTGAASGSYFKVLVTIGGAY